MINKELDLNIIPAINSQSCYLGLHRGLSTCNTFNTRVLFNLLIAEISLKTRGLIGAHNLYL